MAETEGNGVKPRKIGPFEFMCLSMYEQQSIVAWLTEYDINWTEVQSIEEVMKATPTDPGTVRINYREGGRFSLLTTPIKFPWPAALQTHR